MELYKFVWVWVWVVVCQDSKVLHTWNSRDARGSCKKNLSQPGFVNFTKKYIIDWLGIWHESFGFRRPHPPFLGNNSICICAGCALVGFGVGLLVTWNSLHRAISWNLQCAICNIMQDGKISQYWAANMLTVQMQLQGFGRNCKWELGIWKYCKSEQSVFADGAADAAQYGWGGLLVTCPACCQMALTHFT